MQFIKLESSVCCGLIPCASVCGCGTCEQNSIKKQLELLSIKSFKWFLSVCGGLFSSLSVCGSSRLWTELNLETNGTVKHFIIKRLLSICGGLILSLSVCGSCRLWTLFNIETNKTVEHLIINRFLSMCGCLYLFLSVCGFICLWTEFNLETIGTVEHEILQAFPVNICMSYSLCTSVWMLPPVDLSNTVSFYFSKQMHCLSAYFAVGEGVPAVQEFHINSILLTSLEFNCTLTDFLCLWHLLLIYLNVIRNYIWIPVLLN